ncbi:hypothetical protein Rfer_4325 (plasmid) [Rhodoferax ferrireducens T118]|uniref:Uncharacterized protein n=1 Tax=Albidiferax ferrireducens (strain ATCC BAA-621 / DSM 15236 / T118) TaxID=338969 RepID=Q21QD4_ALBFT|nr:hypothetical protein Rfer_4325 [Rhodoferax ferrireducens T118]
MFDRDARSFASAAIARVPALVCECILERLLQSSDGHGFVDPRVDNRQTVVSPHVIKPVAGSDDFWCEQLGRATRLQIIVGVTGVNCDNVCHANESMKLHRW